MAHQANLTVQVALGKMGDNVRDDIEEKLHLLGAALQVLRGQKINGDDLNIGVFAP